MHIYNFKIYKFFINYQITKIRDFFSRRNQFLFLNNGVIKNVEVSNEVVKKGVNDYSVNVVIDTYDP